MLWAAGRIFSHPYALLAGEAVKRYAVSALLQAPSGRAGRQYREDSHFIGQSMEEFNGRTARFQAAIDASLSEKPEKEDTEPV